ncbi:hypothetical protein DY000_02009587 [Brassica cretica]|uniref:Uncharacterized protein n=1 Tax=Brassica cretica TaxID=69181 RepID=A0ABQ7C633_BRACR|nr:hypothetical protein DY000_02009587 [Brassica cretica]
MATTKLVMKLVYILLILFTFTISPAISTAPEGCDSGAENPCIDKAKALPLKIVAIVAILTTSLIGVMAPLFSRHISCLRPDDHGFMIVKCFASGIILGTGFVHVLPDSFEMLSSECLNDDPWHKFPFAGFVAMLSGLATLAIDSITTSFVLELGILFHSVVIGLSLGATNDACTIKGLIIALCFHHLFEGIGLGGCILQADFKNVKKFLMAFFFAGTTPCGIFLGIALSSIYRDNSPTALITTGLLNACSAGMLIYMALVDLLATEFMGSMLQGSIKFQIKCFAAALLGCAIMSVVAKWA